MRIATVSGVLMLLAGCNGLPAEPVNGDNQNLSGSAGAGSKAESSDKTKDGTAAADGTGLSDCELKAKACYAANEKDPSVCDAILKGCTAPDPKPGCGEDCDASVRACFAKGIDAKTCDAQYHACLGSAPPGSGTPANDPVADCQIAAKQCFADGSTPAEKCQALLDSCAQPPPAEDPAVECKLEYVKCLDANPDGGTCEATLEACVKAADAKAADAKASK